MDHHWITLHRIGYAAPRHRDDVLALPPAPAEVWRLCVDMRLDETGLPMPASDAWGALGIYADEASARAVFDAPEAHIPCLDGAVTAWHALAVPVSHRGTVNWRGTAETDAALRCGTAEGPLAVVTTAGYAAPPELKRVQRFMAGIADVLSFYAGLEGNRQRATFNGGPVDGRDGFTLTLWQDRAAMMAAAYRSGTHKTIMEAHEAEPMFDRSSWTRLALREARGDWDGAPLAA